MHKRFSSCLLCFTAIFLAGSCSGDSGPVPDPGSTNAPGGFALKIVNGSFYEVAEIFLIESRDTDAVHLSVECSNAVSLKALCLEITYDQARYCPQSVEPDGILADRGAISLAVLDQPGRIALGQVIPNFPEAKGINGNGKVAQVDFGYGPFVKSGSLPKQSSGVPVTDLARNTLTFSYKLGAFSWRYVNPGDYDQNGEVGISDLTPLGAHFNEQGPFATNSAEYVIDGNGDGLISIQDITPIGANFGNTIDSFRVYGSSSLGDYPSSNSGPNGPGAVLMGSIALPESNPGSGMRRSWTVFTETPIQGGRYWMRPVSDGQEGTPSQLTDEYAPEWHVQQALMYEQPGESMTVAGLSLADINGNPGLVAIIENETLNSYSIYYLRGNDPFGDSWPSPSGVYSHIEPQSAPSLSNISGKPGATWWSSDVGLLYSRAVDVLGSAWLTPVTLATEFDAGLDSVLMEFNGTPLVVYLDGATRALAIAAADADGSSWGEPTTLNNSTNTARVEAAVTSFGLISAADNELDNSIEYAYAHVSGLEITPGSPVVVFSGLPVSSRAAGVGLSGGRPYIAGRRSTDAKVHFSFALDAEGISWTSPSSTGLDGTAGNSWTTTAYGLPWIMYYDPGFALMRCGYAEAPLTNTWINTGEVLAVPGAFERVDMGTVGIHPAAAFSDNSTKMIKLAVYY